MLYKKDNEYNKVDEQNDAGRTGRVTACRSGVCPRIAILSIFHNPIYLSISTLLHNHWGGLLTATLL